LRLQVIPFEPTHLHAVGDLFAATWDRPRSEAFLRWRLLDWPGHHGVVALRPSGECVAFISAARRLYRYPDGVVGPVSETLDWIAHPDLQGAGLGIRVLQKLMALNKAEGVPLLTVGGTEDTRALVPRLGWVEVGDAPSFLLPLAGDALDEQWGRLSQEKLNQSERLGGLVRRFPRVFTVATHLATAVAGRTWFAHPPRVAAPPGGRVVAVAPGVNHMVQGVERGSAPGVNHMVQGVERVPAPGANHMVRGVERGSAPGANHMVQGVERGSAPGVNHMVQGVERGSAPGVNHMVQGVERGSAPGVNHMVQPGAEPDRALFAGFAGTTPLPVPGRDTWLTRCPGGGPHVFLRFEIDGHLVGHSHARLHHEGADIVDIFSMNPELYPWLVQATVARLLPHRPRLIRTRASLPALQAALTQQRFLRGGPVPVLCFAAGGRLPEAPLHLTRGSADEPVLPYPMERLRSGTGRD
jgi:hypothetical protein